MRRPRCGLFSILRVGVGDGDEVLELIAPDMAGVAAADEARGRRRISIPLKSTTDDGGGGCSDGAGGDADGEAQDA